MTRKKVKLAWITNDSARKTSFRKRKEGLLKKLSELSILCDVSGFAIIYGPDDKEPVVWPSRPIAEELLARFQRIPEVDRCKKMMNQETYLNDRNDIDWSYENLGASSDGSGIGLPHVNNGLLQTHYGNVNGSSSSNVRNDAEDIGGINGGCDNIEEHIPQPSNITGGFGSNVGVPHGAGSDTGLPNGLSGESNAESDAGVLYDISKTRKRSFSP
ncbi:hypothetical protein GBA52_004006 [Prunus armeniaca]|nr:hypothetical protein GBA52_004006 [Prunus armeniaca]